MADLTASSSSAVSLNPPKKRKRTAASKPGSKERRPDPVQCPVCFSARLPRLIHTISNCSCIYCTYCLREAFSVALQNNNGISNYPAMCCARVLDYDLFEPHLTSQLRRLYKSKIEEEAEETDNRVYCGNSSCRKYLLQENIKDGFGSCGNCKMKSCVKPECNRPKADHLGIHSICPADLETEELREVANRKGWKRCPKCFALTERIRGCNDIRCRCRTVWCYICGKAIKGSKDVCQCHPLPVRPTPQTVLDEVELQGEFVIVHDDGDAGVFRGRNADMTDVKPSIEGIEAQSGTPFYTDAELLAELTRRAVSPRPSTSRLEMDIMAELDDLAAPTRQGNDNLSKSPSERNTDNVGGGTSSLVRGPSVESGSDTLEDMLQAFHNNGVFQSNSVQVDAITGADHLADHPEKHLDTRSPFTSAGNPPDSSSQAGIGAAESIDSSYGNLTIPPQDYHMFMDKIMLNSNTFNYLAGDAVLASEHPSANSEVNPTTDPDNLKDKPTETNIAELEHQSSQSAQAQDIPASDENSEWLMSSIEEYLGINGGDMK